MPFHSHKLPNGLQIIGETSPSARSVAVGFFVRTGARDETPAEAGVSHFLEHMMFKGTTRRTAEQVNLDFDRIGANNNAFTSEENTVYHAAVLPEYLSKVVDVLADMLRPSLRDADFDTEKKVILEEIKLYDDQPDSVMSEHARRIYYKSHPLGNSVLGTLESVGALTREQMHAYFSRRYAANNIVVSAAGNFDWSAFVKLVTDACGTWNTDTVGRDHRTEWTGTPGLHVLTRDKIQQEYALFVGSGPPADSKMRYAADTVALAVGDYTGSRLYWELVDPGHAESADFGYSENDGSGAVFVSLTCEPDNTADNLKRIEKILKEVQRDGITDEEFHQAKNKILSRVVRRSERPMGRMMAIASMWTYTGEYRDVDAELANFDAVTQADIRTYLDKYPIDRNTVVAFGPLKKLNGIRGKLVPRAQAEPTAQLKTKSKAKPKAKVKAKAKPKATAKAKLTPKAKQTAKPKANVKPKATGKAKPKAKAKATPKAKAKSKAKSKV